MGTIFVHTLRESVQRRMGLVLVVSAVLFAGAHFWFTRFHTLASGAVVVRSRSGATELPAAASALEQYGTVLALTMGLWLFLGIFAVAPLLTSFLEKGWVELLLSKAVPRWQVLLGRYAGSLAVYASTLLLLAGPAAVNFWARAGIQPWPFLRSLGLMVFVFAVIAALMPLVGQWQSNAAAPIMAGFLLTALSPALANRKQFLYPLITAAWAQWLLDWLYRLTPRTFEVQQLAMANLRGTAITSWAPVWWSCLFLAAYLVAAGWLFHRKSF